MLKHTLKTVMEIKITVRMKKEMLRILQNSGKCNLRGKSLGYGDDLHTAGQIHLTWKLEKKICLL